MLSAVEAQQILKTLVCKATSAMFQNKKLKCNATSVNAEATLCPPLLITVGLLLDLLQYHNTNFKTA